jgi:hypothetical protein
MKKLLLFLLLLLPIQSFGSFNVLHSYYGTGGTAAIAYTGATAGSLLVYQTITYMFPTTSVNGDNGNTWIHATSAQCQNVAITTYVDTFYVLSATAGSTIATPVSSASFGHVAGFEASYTGPSIGFDLATCGTGSGAASSLSLTTTYNNEILFGLVVADSGAVTTAPSGWANLHTDTDSFNTGSAQLADAGTNGSKGANFTFSASSNWAETYAAFRDDTSTGGGSVTHSLGLLGVGP